MLRVTIVDWAIELVPSPLGDRLEGIDELSGDEPGDVVLPNLEPRGIVELPGPKPEDVDELSAVSLGVGPLEIRLSSCNRPTPMVPPGEAYSP